MELIRCHRCGRELEDSLGFCPFCGAPTHEASRKLRYIDEVDEEETRVLSLSKEPKRAMGAPLDVEQPIAKVEVRGPAGGLIQTIPLSQQTFSIGRGGEEG